MFKSSQPIEQSVIQYEFDICVTGEIVPCVIWTPPSHINPKALVAMGHGGSQHKACQSIRDRAIRYATTYAWATLAIDAPKHGERISPEEAAIERAKTLARISGDPNAPSLSVHEKIQFLDDLAAQAVPEWQAALDAILSMEIIESTIPIGYWGVSQGSSIGIPLLAVDHRFTCAVLGLAHLHPDHSRLRVAAQHVTIPLRFAFQWDDLIRERAYGLALFDAFGSSEKSMHINLGGHTEIPASEDASWDVFFQYHLNNRMGMK
ncbi:MAG: alpha/beta hydrolase [Chloroflexota bacterium]